jgi:hypothetical protein
VNSLDAICLRTTYRSIEIGDAIIKRAKAHTGISGRLSLPGAILI